ncbi:MAG TPA: ACP phosphodiesterase [Rhodanobacteraceae bacterium]
MNVLAHALLASPDAELMLGSVVGDFVRGRIDPSLPPKVRAGIALHRAVDSYTDAHADIAAARALFAPPFRRYAGILLDVWFDHLLARQWARFGEDGLDDFSERVRGLLAVNATFVPERMRGFAAYLEANDLPAAYRDTAMIGQALRGMSRRLKRANPLGEALPVLVALHAPLQRCFESFFPDLRNFADIERGRLVEPDG